MFANLYSKIQSRYSTEFRPAKKKILPIYFLGRWTQELKKINLSYNKNTYIGKISDRIFGTLYRKYAITEQQQLKLIDDFNNFLNQQRELYNNLILTKYRDGGRKRISLENIYKICTYLLDQK